MASDLHDYFRMHCVSTQNAVQNMESLFKELHKGVENPQLKDLLRQQYEALRDEERNLEQINETLGKKEAKKLTTAINAGERIFIVGRRWVGPLGKGVLEEHRVFVEEIPQQVVDINSAMLAEEVSHFNLGNYTGLIIIAKQLGEMAAANLLQQNIDRETAVRTTIEHSLWQIVGELQVQQKKAA